MTNEQLSLLTDEATTTAENLEAGLEASPGAAESIGLSRSCYFLTNTRNLVSILSSRLVGPRESLVKYYADLLELCQGWVPLLCEPPTSKLIEIVTGSAESLTPALIEFDRKLTVDGERVVFVPCLPLSWAKAIHFPSESTLREFSARSYANVHSDIPITRVSPQLFSSNASEIVIHRPSSLPRVADWNRIDRLRGALSAMLCSLRSGDQLLMIYEALSGETMSTSALVPIWFRWPFNSSEFLESDSVRSRSERGLFLSAVQSLASLDRTLDWRPRALLNEIRIRCVEMSLPADCLALLERDLDHLHDVLSMEASFSPFRDGDGLLDVSRALLLVLLRPDLSDLSSWPTSENGADEFVDLLSRMLSGLLRGLARESIALRSRELDDLTAEWVSVSAQGESLGFLDTKFMQSKKGTELWSGSCCLGVSGSVSGELIGLFRNIPPTKREEAKLLAARKFGFPLLAVATATPDSFVEVLDDKIIVSSSQMIDVIVTVDEDEFVLNLSRLTGGSRQQMKRLLQRFIARAPGQ